MKQHVHACVCAHTHTHYSKCNTGLMTQEIEIPSLPIKEEESVRISKTSKSIYFIVCM